MAKTARNTPSVRKRREEEQKRRQARQNRIISITGGVLAVIVIAVLVWVLWPEPEVEPATVLAGERPLTEIEPPLRNRYYSAYPENVLENGVDYQAVIRTERGDITVDLYEDEAPLAVNSFVFLATQGFYDGTTFHRVLPGFMAQGGDPTGSGTGGPGYEFANEVSAGLSFDRGGVLAMANAGADTNGSQFFITFDAASWLDGGYTIFGSLLEGEDVLDSLTLRDPEENPDFTGDLIERIDILEN